MVDKLPGMILGGSRISFARLLSVASASKIPMKAPIGSPLANSFAPTFQFLDWFEYCPEKCLSCECPRKPCETLSNVHESIVTEQIYEEVMGVVEKIITRNRKTFTKLD